MIVVLIEHRVLDFQSMRQDRGTVKDRERESVPFSFRGCRALLLDVTKLFYLQPNFFAL